MSSENSIPTAIYHASGCRARVVTRHLNRSYTSYDDSQCTCHVAAIAEKDAKLQALEITVRNLTETLARVEAKNERLRRALPQIAELAFEMAELALQAND